MRVGGAPFVALGCTILLASCGLGSAGLGLGHISDDASAPEGSALASDATTTGSDASESAESGTEDAEGGAIPLSDAGADGTASPADSNDTGETATGTEAGSASDSAGGPDAYTDASTCADAGDCLLVPAGWTVVSFASSQASSCPPGFGQLEDLVEGPDATKACVGCSKCGVTTQPSCAGGPIDVLYDSVTGTAAGTCNQPASVTPLGNSPAGTCLTDLYQGDYAPFDVMYVPSGPSGGACASPGVKASSNLTYAAHDRVCQPTSAPAVGCNGKVCTPPLTGPYAACITARGDLACPAGPLSARHLLGTDTSFDCSTCACTVTGLCSGTVTLYSDTKCQQGALPVPADSTCNSIVGLTNNPAPSYRSYVYAPNTPTQVACAASGSSSASNVAPTNPTTVCCAP